VQVQVLDVVLGLQKLEIERLVEDDLFQFFVFGFGRPLLGQRKRAVSGFPVFRLGRARRVYAARSVSKQQLVLGGHQPHPAQRVLVVREDCSPRGFPSRSTRRRKMRPSRLSESGFHSSEKQFVLLRFGWISSAVEREIRAPIRVDHSSSSSSPRLWEGHRAPERLRAGVYAGPGAWVTPAGEGTRGRRTRARSRASRAWARARAATARWGRTTRRLSIGCGHFAKGGRALRAGHAPREDSRSR
jgi:hypothetical protein